MLLVPDLRTSAQFLLILLTFGTASEPGAWPHSTIPAISGSDSRFAAANLKLRGGDEGLGEATLPPPAAEDPARSTYRKSPAWYRIRVLANGTATFFDERPESREQIFDLEAYCRELIAECNHTDIEDQQLMESKSQPSPDPALLNCMAAFRSRVQRDRLLDKPPTRGSISHRGRRGARFSDKQQYSRSFSPHRPNLRAERNQYDANELRNQPRSSRTLSPQERRPSRSTVSSSHNTSKTRSRSVPSASRREGHYHHRGSTLEVSVLDDFESIADVVEQKLKNDSEHGEGQQGPNAYDDKVRRALRKHRTSFKEAMKQDTYRQRDWNSGSSAPKLQTTGASQENPTVAHMAQRQPYASNQKSGQQHNHQTQSSDQNRTSADAKHGDLALHAGEADLAEGGVQQRLVAKQQQSSRQSANPGLLSGLHLLGSTSQSSQTSQLLRMDRLPTPNFEGGHSSLPVHELPFTERLGEVQRQPGGQVGSGGDGPLRMEVLEHRLLQKATAPASLVTGTDHLPHSSIFMPPHLGIPRQGRIQQSQGQSEANKAGGTAEDLMQQRAWSLQSNRDSKPLNVEAYDADPPMSAAKELASSSRKSKNKQKQCKGERNSEGETTKGHWVLAATKNVNVGKIASKSIPGKDVLASSDLTDVQLAQRILHGVQIS